MIEALVLFILAIGLFAFYINQTSEDIDDEENAKSNAATVDYREKNRVSTTSEEDPGKKNMETIGCSEKENNENEKCPYCYMRLD